MIPLTLLLYIDPQICAYDVNRMYSHKGEEASS